MGQMALSGVRTRTGFQLIALGAVALLLAGCSGNLGRGGAGTKLSKRVVSEGQRVPKGGGRYKVGKPYQIAGKWYHPREDRTYDRTGIASWYGTLFHGRRTANGEIFDMNALTAAHPTLPLPSLVRVTNLRNGRSIVVRVNDRGPYKQNRVIDMSRYGAQLLDFKKAGTALVRVTYLRPAPLNGDDRYERSVLANQPWMRMARSAGGQPITTAAVQQYQNTPRVRREPRHINTYAEPHRLAPPAPARPAFRQPPSAGPLYVQVGVYQMQQNARAMAARLRPTAASRVDPVMISGRLYYSVRLGPFLTRAQAEHGVRLTADVGVSDARIIPSPYQ